jgi:inosine-uridine nucleoside N-ribohydrolase
MIRRTKMNYKFTVPESKRIKVIIDTDTKNEADDQFAVMHALLTPKFDIRGIIATHFGHQRIKGSLEASYEELMRVLHYSGFEGKVKAVKGCATALQHSTSPSFFPGAYEPQDNDGVRMIIDEAMKCNGERLYIGVLGPLTNVASAIMIEPAIEHKIVVVWNGGGVYPHGEPEFNLVNDIGAANVLMASDAEIWQIPTNVYAKPRASLAELQYKVQPCGEIGNYLFTQLIEFLNESADSGSWPRAESLDICDLTIIGLLMEDHKFCYTWEKAPFITPEMRYEYNPHSRPIRVYHDIDGRYILEDLFAKLAINYGK